MKCRVYIHHASLDAAWRRYQRNSDRLHQSVGEIAWSNLSAALVSSLDKSLAGTVREPIDVRGITIYASVKPPYAAADDDATKAEWLGRLDQLPGVTVKRLEERLRDTDCGACKVDRRDQDWFDKGVDTRIACDLVSMAVEGFYDVAILVSEDDELIPAVETVQDLLDRKVIHAGFQFWGDRLRGACWGHVVLDDIVSAISLEGVSGRFDPATTTLALRP